MDVEPGYIVVGGSRGGHQWACHVDHTQLGYAQVLVVEMGSVGGWRWSSQPWVSHVGRSDRLARDLVGLTGSVHCWR